IGAVGRLGRTKAVRIIASAPDRSAGPTKGKSATSVFRLIRAATASAWDGAGAISGHVMPPGSKKMPLAGSKPGSLKTLQSSRKVGAETPATSWGNGQSPRREMIVLATAAGAAIGFHLSDRPSYRRHSTLEVRISPR